MSLVVLPSQRLRADLYDLPISALNVPKLFVSLYKKWDFSKSAEVRLVASRQGTWKGWEEMRRGGGVVALASAVKSFEFGSSGKWEVECQVSRRVEIIAVCAR